jgi:hypothetical protein
VFGTITVLHENLREMACEFIEEYSSDPNVLLKIRENRKASRPAWDVLIKEFGAKRGRVVYTLYADLKNIRTELLFYKPSNVRRNLDWEIS